MSLSPNSALLQRTIDLQYANRKRASSLKWIFVNTFFFLLFAYDLWHACPGRRSALHYAEAGAAAALAAGALHHARRALPARRPPLPLSRRQLRLLGLAPPDLDSSFVLTEERESPARDVRGERAAAAAADAGAALSPPRAWRSPPPARASPPPPSPPAAPAPPAPRDRFIADRQSLTDYLKQWSESEEAEEASAAPPAWPAPAAPPPPAYQLAALDTESSKLEEAAGGGSPQVWWRLHLDPQRLTQWNLNLRLWIHVTILERLVRELRAAGWAGAGAVPAALAPYVEPFADKAYALQRAAELAAGGALSGYRWRAGGSAWDEGKPTDAELVLHLLATYLDSQMPSAGSPRPFSATHLSVPPAPPPRGPRALALRRVCARPPHYALVLGDETLEVSRGRNNLLHSLLLLLAAAARRRPPALARTHLGPAGLNMLWIIGR